MSYIAYNQYGVFCTACGEGPLSIEEGDWECCDAVAFLGAVSHAAQAIKDLFWKRRGE